MGQIIFPTTLGWKLGSFTNVRYMGEYLRLQYLHEDNTQPYLSFPVAVDANTGLLYWDISGTNWRTFKKCTGNTWNNSLVAQLLYDSTNDIGGGVRILYYNKYRVRNATSFIGAPITDSDYVGILVHAEYVNIMDIKLLFHNQYERFYDMSDAVYTNQMQLRLARVFALTSGLVQSLYFDVLGNRFKSQGEWLSPIIDLGPYINITSLEVQNYVVPTGGDVKIFYRASGSAPSTGSPIAFTDTSGNTLYYYGPNETWTASDWVEVPSGSVPTYKDRFVQLKLQLIAA